MENGENPTIMKNPPCFSGVLVLACLCASTVPARSALLVYDGFTYAGANLNGIAPNANTIGLRDDVNFSGTGAETGTGHYTLTTGLTFGSLITSGRALAFGTTPANSVLSSQLSIGAQTGTLFYSYLINFSTIGTASGNGFEVRVGSADSTEGVRFRSFADSRNGTDNIAGADYNGSGIATGTGAVMQTGTTYLVVSSFTRVGQAVSPTPGVGTTYVFTNAQFEHMMSQADPTAYFNSLGALSVGNGITQVYAFAQEEHSSASVNLPANYKLHLVNVKDAGVVDEIRMGTDLLSVLPVPEPGTAVLGTVAAAVTLLRRRRNERSR